MICPFCGEEMEEGRFENTIRGCATVKWSAKGKKYSFFDRLAGMGRVKSQFSFPTHFINGYYCYKCKKLILDTEIEK